MYHVNPKTGNAGPCKAQVGQCPFGPIDEHFVTIFQARAAYEKRMDEEMFSRVSYWHGKPWIERKAIIAEEVKAVAAQYNMGEVNVSWVKNDAFLARADHRNYAIQFSEKLEHVEKEKISNTVVHELAHLRLGPGKGHGQEWLAVANEMGEDQDLALKDFENRYILSRTEQLRLVSSKIAEANNGWVTTCARGHLGYEKRCANSMMACAACIDDGIDRAAAILRFSPVNAQEKHPATFMEKARQHNIESQAVGTFEHVRKILGEW